MSTAARKIDDRDDESNRQLDEAVVEARAAVRRGEVVPHERVREWLLAMANGEHPPLPIP